MSDNKVEIKINVDSSQAQKGIAGVNSMLNSMRQYAAKASESGLSGISSAFDTIKTNSLQSLSVKLPTDEIQKTATAIGNIKQDIPSAVMNMSALTSSMSSVRNYGRDISNTADLFDTIKVNAGNAGKAVGSAFSVKIPHDDLEIAANELDNIYNSSKPLYSGLTDVSTSILGIKSSALATAIGTVFAFNQIVDAATIVKDKISDVFGMIHDGAQAVDIERVFKNQTSLIGADADAMLSQIKESTQNTITDMQGEMIGNQAMIAKMSANDVATTMSYLRQYANATGKSFDQLMTTIFTGLSRGSTLMLDDAGIIINQTDLVNQKEKELGKTLSALGQKKVIVAEAIRQMSDNMKQFGDVTLSATSKLDRMIAKFDNWYSNFKKNMAADINDTLVLVAGASSVQEKINALKGKIERASKAASYDPINNYLVKKLKKELAELIANYNELKRNASIYNQQTAPKKTNQQRGTVKLGGDDFTTGGGTSTNNTSSNSTEDPLASIKSQLQSLKDTNWQIMVDIKTVGLDEFQKRRIDAEEEYNHTVLKLKHDRTKDNSTYTDKSIVEAMKIRNSKIALANAEEKESHYKKVSDDLKNFKLTVDTSSAESGLDEFDKRLLRLKQDYESILSSTGITDAQKKSAQAAYDNGVSAINNERAREISEKLKGFSIEIDTSVANKNLDEFNVRLTALTDKYNELLNTKGISAEQVAQAERLYNKGTANIEHQRQNSISDRNLEQFINTTPMPEYDAESLRLSQQLDTGQIDKALFDSKKAMLDYKASIGDVEKGIVSLGGTITNKDIIGAFNAMTPAVSDFLTTFAETGEFDVSALANGLLKSMQAYAAQQTAELLMQGLYHTAMTFIEPEDPTHAAKASTAYTSAAFFGSIVAGSGLAGMAHDGIDAIPEDGTWLLKKKERIVGASLNQDLTTFLSNQTSNIADNSSSGHTFNNYFYSQDADGIKQITPALQKQIENSLLRSDRFRRAYGGK